MTDPVHITLREGQGYLTALPPALEEPIRKATSFRPTGYQYDWRFQRGKWDGWVHLYKHHKFPAGLLSIIITELRKKGVPYHLDADTAKAEKPDLALELVDMEDRPYQLEATEATMLAPRGVIRAPTGSGKTAIGARVIVARSKWALVIVPTIDLLYQYRDFLEAHLYDPEDREDNGRVPIGQLGDGVVDPRPVTVATARTAAKVVGVAYESYEFGEYDDRDDTEVNARELRDWIERVGTVIVDEAHILGAQTIFDIVTAIPAPNKYGMSASPWRDDGADLMITAATGPPIYRIGTETLVEDSYLVPPVIQVVDTRSWWKAAAWGQVCTHCGRQRWRDLSGPVKKCLCGNTRWRSQFTDAYREEIVENITRNMRIAEKVQSVPKPVLVIVKQIKHGRLLRDLIPGSVFLSGKDKGRDRVDAYERVRNGTLEVVIATTIADLGLDLPALRSLVLAAGGKSSTRHLQRIGRATRPAPGKSTALVVDFDDGHVHRWFRGHAAARRKIEKAEWGSVAIWL